MNIERAVQTAIEHYQKQNYQKAEEMCKKILHTNPDNVDILTLLAEVYYHRNEYDGAIDSIRKALEQNPDDAHLYSNLGLILLRKGQFDDAIVSFKKALHLNPDLSQAYYNLGILFREKGQHDEAIKSYQKALDLNPKFIEAYINLGIALQEQKCPDEALICYQKAHELNPNLGDIYYNIGTVLQEKKQFEQAITYYQKALNCNPHLVDAYFNLGAVYKEKKQYDQAILSFQKALELNPNRSDAYSSLGLALQEKGLTDDAIRAYRMAIHLDPKNIIAYLGMGVVSQDERQFDEAITCYRKALEIDPTNALVYIDLGTAYREKWHLNDAMMYFQKARQLSPDSADVYYNIGAVHLLQGDLNKARENYHQALGLNPEFITVHQNLLMISHYATCNSAEAIFSEHLRFAQKFAEPLSSSIEPHSNERRVDRRLRIGYLSPDFRKHSVAYFIEPVLRAHNRGEFEVFCYSNVSVPDEVTKRIQGYADFWRDITKASDEDVTELIRRDGIDILVDLAGHTGNNRILIFARKPAPVQVSWIGYPGTTGLSTIDSKIVDAYTDPSKKTEQFYTEELIRLPESFLCYLPDRESPDVNTLPALKTGHITFGSFNNIIKVSPEVIALWAKILKAVPGSRLIMKTYSFSDSTTCRNMMDLFLREGVAEGRIALYPPEPSVWGHLAFYHQVDIGLDTFPYHGTTTTCEALWMGVPVITLEGETHASRVGVSLLSNVGLRELIAAAEAEYVKIAVYLSNDVEKLKLLRERLRTMMTQSPLTQAERFTQHLEECYRVLWKRWCKSKTGRGYGN